MKEADRDRLPENQLQLSNSVWSPLITRRQVVVLIIELSYQASKDLTSTSALTQHIHTTGTCTKLYPFNEWIISSLSSWRNPPNHPQMQLLNNFSESLESWPLVSRSMLSSKTQMPPWKVHEIVQFLSQLFSRLFYLLSMLYATTTYIFVATISYIFWNSQQTFNLKHKLL